MFIEAMADAAVADGMPRKQAYHFAAQTVLGKGRWYLRPGDIRGIEGYGLLSRRNDDRGVAALEKEVRTAVIEHPSRTRKAKNI